MEGSEPNETGNGPGEDEERDSGDSLFITQDPQKLSSPRRPPRLSHRSRPVSHRLLESGSSSEEDEVPVRRKSHSQLPKYSFPFLHKRKAQCPEDGSVSSARNRAIHYGGVEGFFSCAAEMWLTGRQKSSVSTLPMVDVDNEEITPITEDEKSDQEDIKIIDKKQFVYSLKPKLTKRSQSWMNFKHKTTNSQQRFRTEKAQSTSNKTESSSDEQHMDSSSDETFIDESILQEYHANNAQSHNVNLTQVNQDTQHGNEVASLDQLEDMEEMEESQSILQNNPLDIRGRQRKSPKKTHCNNLMTESNSEKPNNVKCGLGTTLMTKLIPESCNQEKEISGPSHSEKAELLFCSNVEENGDGIVQKKKRRKREKIDVENDEKKQNGTCSDSSQITNREKEMEEPSADNGDGSVLKKKKKKEKKNPNGSCLDLVQVVNIENEMERPSYFEEAEKLCYPVVHDDGTGTKQKKKKHKKKKDSLENVDTSQIVNNTQLDDMTAEDTSVSDMSEAGRKRQKKRKLVYDCEEEAFTLKELPLHDKVQNSSSRLVKSQESSDIISNNITGTECINPQGDELVSVRKKKKKMLILSTENEQNGTSVHPVQTTNDHFDKITAVDMNENGRKHKKQKAVRNNDEDSALKELPLHNADQSSSSGLIDFKLNKSKSSGLDGSATQGDESVSVRKKKKKKKQVAETVENVTIELSQSGEGHGLSTIDIESAETNTLIRDTELSNTFKKKKRKESGEFSHLDSSVRKAKSTQMNQCNESKNSDSAYVIQSPSDGYGVKKKKKKSQSQSHLTDIEQTKHETEESAILSPKASGRKNAKEKKGVFFDESVAEETELEHSPVKRKKLKKSSKAEDPSISSPSRVEIGPSSDELEKSSRTKVKKRLHNPNDTFLDTF